MSRFVLIMVTVPDIDLARSLVKAALEPKLAACANIIPAVESHYWWEGKIENGNELLILFKTIEEKIPELENRVLI